MKRKSTLKRVLTSLALLVGMGANGWAQTFPTFTYDNPLDMPSLYRGTAVWGDYNNDGKLDLLFTGLDSNGNEQRVGIYKNTGTGFELVSLPVEAMANGTLVWIDFNNDGNLDIIYAGGNDEIYLLMNKGESENYIFEKVEDTGLYGISIPNEQNYASVIAIGDYDNDGYQDVIITGLREEIKRVDLYKNDSGTGKFILQDNPLRDRNGVNPDRNFYGVSGGCVVFADLNNNNCLDIIVSGEDEEGDALTKIYINQQDGKFIDNNFGQIHTREGQIVVGDFNNDGVLEIIFSGIAKNQDKVLTICYNSDIKSDNTVSYRRENSKFKDVYQVFRSGLDIADLDNNGTLDLVFAGAAGSSNAVSGIWLQTLDDDFVYNQEEPFGKARSGVTVSLADYNNDGYLDITCMGYRDNNNGMIKFNILKNNADPEIPVNTPPTQPINLKSSYEDGKMTFTWTAGKDKETADEALRYNFYLKRENGEIYTLIPADLETGFLKVANHTLFTALTTTSITLDIEDGYYEWGVQTIDQGKMSSPFTRTLTFSDKDQIKLTGTWGKDDIESLYASNVFTNVKLTSIDLTEATFPADAPGLNIANKNCLVYVAADADYPSYWQNVVKGETAEKIELIDNNQGLYYPFNNLYSFTAKEITYTRNYPEAGWSSICLPFEVTSLPEGIIPEVFKSSNETTIVFAPVETMEANTPHIVEITSTGDKVYQATNVTVEISSEVKDIAPENSDYIFKGVYERIGNAEGLYILDPNGKGFSIGKATNYLPSFRAYLKDNGTSPNGTPQLALEHGEGTTNMEVIEKDSLKIYVVNGIIRIESPILQTVQIHSPDGKIIRNLSLAVGDNSVTGISNGVYLINNQKVVVR